LDIKCIIVDDEPLARAGLKDYVDEISFLVFKGEFKNALEANDYLKENKVDLMFLDINMPKISGLEFAKNLENPPLIIFTTAYREFAAESYEVEGFDYLVKPISFNRFFKSANKAQTLLNAVAGKTDEHFFIKADGKIIKIRVSEVLFIESMKDYVKIQLEKESYKTLLSLKQIEKELPEEEFIRVHRSFIISKTHISSIDGNQIQIGEKKVPIAPNLRSEMLDKILGDNLWKRS